MKTTIWLLILCVLFGISKPAAAQDGVLIGTLSKRGMTVAKVMEAARCEQTVPVLKQVLKDSRIPPKQVRRLPIGQKVFYSGDKCKMVAQSAVGDSVQSAVSAVLDSTSRAKKALENKVAEMEKRLEAVSDSAKRAPPAPYSSWVLVVLGVVFGMLLMYGVSLYFYKDKISFVPLVKVSHQNKVHVFDVVGFKANSLKSHRVFVPKLKCPYCCIEFFGDPVEHLRMCDRYLVKVLEMPTGGPKVEPAPHSWVKGASSDRK